MFPESIQRPGPIVEIEWSDIATESGWSEIRDLGKVSSEPITPCLSVGYLVAEEPDRVIIVQSVMESFHGERTVIPRAVITKMRQIARALK